MADNSSRATACLYMATLIPLHIVHCWFMTMQEERAAAPLSLDRPIPLLDLQYPPASPVHMSLQYFSRLLQTACVTSSIDSHPTECQCRESDSWIFDWFGSLTGCVHCNQAWKTDQLPAVLTELVHSKSEFLVNRLLRMIFAAITNLEMRVKERLSALPYSLFIVCDRRQSLDKRIHVAKQFCCALDCCVPRGAASSIKAHCQ